MEAEVELKKKRKPSAPSDSDSVKLLIPIASLFFEAPYASNYSASNFISSGNQPLPVTARAPLCVTQCSSSSSSLCSCYAVETDVTFTVCI